MPRLRDVGRMAALRGRQAVRLARYFTHRRRPAEIVAYRGYASRTRAYLHGRVVGRPAYTPATPQDRAWRNLLNMYRRLRSSPVPHAEVRATFAGHSLALRSDDEGFFGEWIDLQGDARLEPGWTTGSVQLPGTAGGAPAVTAEAEVMIPDERAGYGVISDIDDTVIQSHVNSFLRAARVVLFGNSLTRLPFEGVAEFYAGLARGVDDGVDNPLFYVSSSPWNLYDVIDDFLAVQGIPHGPLLLRDWDLRPSALAGSAHHTHKEAAIREVMDTYPRLPFILIGDSGQKDPEIYAHVVHEYGTRVLAVYIRDVVRNPDRGRAISELASEVSSAGSSLLLVHDTREAAEHAASRGWIVREEVEAVAREAAADAGEAPGKKPVD